MARTIPVVVGRVQLHSNCEHADLVSVLNSVSLLPQQYNRDLICLIKKISYNIKALFKGPMP